MLKAKTLKVYFAVFLVVVGILLCLNTLFSYSYFSDLNFGVVAPAVIGMLCLAYALKIILLKKPLIKSRQLRIVVMVFCVVCFILFVTIEVFIFIDPVTHDSDRAGHVDTLIVLGCGIWPDGRPTLSLTERLDKAIIYYKENPHVNIIVSGGKGPNEPFPKTLAKEKILI